MVLMVCLDYAESAETRAAARALSAAMPAAAFVPNFRTRVYPA